MSLLFLYSLFLLSEEEDDVGAEEGEVQAVQVQVVRLSCEGWEGAELEVSEDGDGGQQGQEEKAEGDQQGDGHVEGDDLAVASVVGSGQGQTQAQQQSQQRRAEASSDLRTTEVKGKRMGGCRQTAILGAPALATAISEIKSPTEFPLSTHRK